MANGEIYHLFVWLNWGLIGGIGTPCGGGATILLELESKICSLLNCGDLRCDEQLRTAFAFRAEPVTACSGGRSVRTNAQITVGPAKAKKGNNIHSCPYPFFAVESSRKPTNLYKSFSSYYWRFPSIRKRCSIGRFCSLGSSPAVWNGRVGDRFCDNVNFP